MSDTVTAIVGHRLGKVEAVRRLKEGLARTNGNLGLIAMEQETWEGDTLRFRMRALGQTAAASVEVLEDALRIEVSLPWLLAKAAKRLLPVLRKEATLLLARPFGGRVRCRLSQVIPAHADTAFTASESA